jgi:elongator complex protein 4
LRRYPYACASVSLPPHLSADSRVGQGWINKLSWLSDAAFTLSAFSGLSSLLICKEKWLIPSHVANPSLIAMFPSHHGLLHIHTLPAPHSLLPPSDKFSTLRGLSTSATSGGGSGENNLTFKCTRKRLIFETLHLDIEGGVGERRTALSAVAIPANTSEGHDLSVHSDHQISKAALAAVEVTMEDVKLEKASLKTDSRVIEATEVPDTKPKKKVAFRSDRPDLYDF